MSLLSLALTQQNVWKAGVERKEDVEAACNKVKRIALTRVCGITN